jgi:D-sedoheptulose 7-phosphate isomerase
MCEELLADEQVAPTVDAVVDAVVAAIRGGGKVLLCGNGGSAAEAEHLAAELIGRFCLDRSPFPAMALGSNVSALTAIANDYDYADVFARSVTGLGRAGDVVMGFSTSGRSENVVAALKAGRAGDMVTVALTGPSGSPMGEVADHTLYVPGSRTAGIQQGHLLLGHVIFERVEHELCET